MKQKCQIITIVLLLLVIYNLRGQTVYQFTLDNNTVHISPSPPNMGSHPPTDYNSVSKPLIAEPFATNAQAGINANTIHSNAGSVNNVFFGGDLPSGAGGQRTTPLITKQVFTLSDFPIYLETDFYSHNSSGEYNEAYFWIGPSNYQYYSATFMSPIINREGIYVGKFPNNTTVANNNSVTQPTNILIDTIHNLSSYGNWYNFKAVLDVLNGNLILRDVKINNQCVFDYNFTFTQIPWLNDYRIAVCADDLVKDFTIITNYSSFTTEFAMSDSVICEGNSIDLTDLTNSENCTSNNTFNWSFTGTIPNSSTQQNPTNITYSTTGTYPIVFTRSDGYTSQTITKNITVIPSPNVDLGSDTIICFDSSIILDASSPNATSYLWQDGSTNSTLTVSQAGNYSVIVTNTCGTASDIINVTFETSNLYLNLGNDTTLCREEILNLDVTHPDATEYLWQDSSTSPNYTITSEGIYIAEISNACETKRDTIIVDYALLSVNFGNDSMAICEGETYILDAFNSTALSYLWQDSSTNSTYEVTEAGVYHVEIKNQCEVISDTVEILVSQNSLILELGANLNICEGDTIILDATTENGIWYIWSDSTTSLQKIVTSPNEFEVTVISGCGEITDNISITGEDCCDLFIPNAFTPNGDGNNDVFKVYQSSQGCNTIVSFSMTVFDRWGGIMYHSTNIDVGWNGFSRGKKSAEGVYVWMIEYNDGFKDYQKSGDVTILR